MSRPWLMPVLLILISSLTFGDDAIDPFQAELDAIDRIDKLPGLDLSPRNNTKLGFDIGYVSLPNADGTELIGWQRFSVRPEFSLGDFDLGLILDLHMRLNGGMGPESVQFRTEDWVPDASNSLLDIYVPKILFINYGKENNALKLRFGGLEQVSLGNGFIFDSYRNTTFMPQKRIFGINIDLNGEIISFPYAGIQGLVANLARLDVMGIRIFIRPVADLNMTILKDMQIGFSAGTDSNPHLYNPDVTIQANSAKASVAIFGMDFSQPVFVGKQFNLRFFGDVAGQNSNLGTQIGIAGSIFDFFNYAISARFLGSSFIPGYFDQTYDIVREQRYQIFQGSTPSPAYSGWFARLGTSLGEDLFLLTVDMSGPFETSNDVLPQLRARLSLKKGAIGDLSANIWYQKDRITGPADLFSPLYAYMGAEAAYEFGPAKVSMLYSLQYDPYASDAQAWQARSKIETSLSIFEGGN